MPSIYLVRHGITRANRENRFAGRSREELLAEGREQISQVGLRLQHINIGRIYCSPATRTVQSAAILGSLLAIPFFTDEGLDEINIPHWEGLSKDEIKKKFGEQYPGWLSAPQNFRLPGCESLQQVQERAAEAVRRILAEGWNSSILLVSHLIVLRCLVLYFVPVAPLVQRYVDPWI